MTHRPLEAPAPLHETYGLIGPFYDPGESNARRAPALRTPP